VVKKRRCGICGGIGHNARSCSEKDKPLVVAQSVSTQSRAKKKEKELGHKLLAEKNKKVDREEIDGLIPAKGLWIVHHPRKKIAGKIVKVKKNGDVVWRSALGASITTPQNSFKEEGYSYLIDLEPEMLLWKIV